MATVTVTVLFFAQAREATGLREASVTLPAGFPSAQRLLDDLVTVHFPALAALGGSLVLAVDEEYVDLAAPLTLRPRAVVALIPPLSGG